MRELVKGYITPKAKKELETLAITIPYYEIALDIGISETSLRSDIKGKGLKKSLCDKVENYLKEQK